MNRNLAEEISGRMRVYRELFDEAENGRCKIIVEELKIMRGWLASDPQQITSEKWTQILDVLRLCAEEMREHDFFVLADDTDSLVDDAKSRIEDFAHGNG